MVGVALERTNLDPLTSLVSSLDPVTCRDLAKALEQMDARRESMMVTRSEERIWVAHVSSFQERMGLRVMRLVRPRNLEVPWETSAAKLAEILAQEHALVQELTARADRNGTTITTPGAPASQAGTPTSN